MAMFKNVLRKAKQNRLNQRTREQPVVRLNGGMDISTDFNSRDPADAAAAVNFEPGLRGGFIRCAGHERFDGRTSPTAGSTDYYLIELTTTAGVDVGDVMFGLISGAQVTVSMVDGNFVVGILNINNLDFEEGESINLGAGLVVKAEPAGETLNFTDTEILLASQAYLSSLIQQPPGSGPVRGVYMHRGRAFAFRDNAGGTAGVAYKATSTGWQALPTYQLLRFDAGSNEFDIGGAILSSTGGIGVVRKIVILDGGWGDSDAKGYMLITVTSGTFLDNNALTGTGVAVADGNIAAQPAILPGGKYRFISHNFYAQAPTYNIYGCDGVNLAFEIDENDVYTPIFTKTVPDTPKYLGAHKFHLCLAIKGSLIISEPGRPFAFDGLLGATEIAVGDDATGVRSQPGETLVVSTIRSTFGLVGANSDESPFRLEVISEDAGAQHYSYVSLGYPYGINDQGVVAQQRVNSYGNFESSTISSMIQPLIDEKGMLVIDSSVLRKRNQIRFFFSDKTAIVIGFLQTNEGQQARATQLEFPYQVSCVCNGTGLNGEERILYGTEDGWVLEGEKGWTFDGIGIDYTLRMNPFRPTPQLGQFFELFNVTAMIRGDSNFDIAASCELSFGDDRHPVSREIQRSVTGIPGYYDESVVDTIYYYDVSTVSRTKFKFTGVAEAAALTFYGDDPTTRGFVIDALQFDISQRGQTLD